ncbi:hypothetical protein ACFWF9_36970, partial [Streptomyces roseolus]|uniref:hypothetical protein n=1 Tax=Streptomyces roseolus TaxID=67358 RepID=UPI00365B848A
GPTVRRAVSTAAARHAAGRPWRHRQAFPPAPAGSSPDGAPAAGAGPGLCRRGTLRVARPDGSGEENRPAARAQSS